MNNSLRKFTIAFIGLLFVAAAVQGAETKTNLPPRLYRDRVEPHWFADANGATNAFWYRVNLPGQEREYILVDAERGKRLPAFDHARLAEALAKESGKIVDPKRLPIDDLEFTRDGKSVLLRGQGASWKLELESYTLTRLNRLVESGRHLPASLTPHPSTDTGIETEIEILNRLGRAVNLFWIDSEGKRQPYGSLQPGESRSQHTYAGHVWLVTDSDDVVAVFEAERSPGVGVVDGQSAAAPRRRRDRGEDRKVTGVRSPDQKWEAIVHGDDLFLRDVGTGKEQPLSYDANPSSTYKRNAEADRAIELEYDRSDPERPLPEVYWSPDSRHLVAMRLQPGTQRRVYLVESSPEDQLQPKLVSYPYLKPGDNVPVRKPHLFEVATTKEIKLDDALFSNPWSVDEVRWKPDSTRFTFLYNQRGHQVLRILAVNAASGSVQPVVEERSETFICYSGKYFCEYLDSTDEIIWMSERDGWNHLYLYDAKSGRVKNQITHGDWVVRGVDRVDAEKRQVWFHAGGLRAGEDPYYIHYARINFDGSGLTILTEGDGTHSIEFSPDKRFIIDSWSRVDMAPVIDLRRADSGKLSCRLEEADASELFASGWKAPERFVAKGRDGSTDIYGVIYRPSEFDAARKYPVIEDIYAGPQDSYVPKSFHTAYRDQKIADRGFIMVQIDGMGTANRSKKFHDVCFKNLADSGFPDRILWIKAAAAKYPSMDLNRVGLYGTSAGGQNALRGLLDHGDFYKAGVSDSGCHDNRMDKIWWNEQWMGWPLDESYVRCSNVTDAHKLTGKLLLMVGEMDRNVDPASTMQVVNALIKADKDFELLDMPGMGHGVARTPYGARRLEDFFVQAFLTNNLRPETARR
ncbi:MAG: DPP IV N-terminal domain-containing protein [Verrucomicrobiota bacterium]